MISADILAMLFGKKPEEPAPTKSLQDQWSDHISQVQSGVEAPAAPANPMLAMLPAWLGGGKSTDQGFGQPGPASPVDYTRMKAILNSGVLRKPDPNAPNAAPEASPMIQGPAPAPPRPLPRNPIEALLGSLANYRR